MKEEILQEQAGFLPLFELRYENGGYELSKRYAVLCNGLPGFHAQNIPGLEQQNDAFRATLIDGMSFEQQKDNLEKKGYETRNPREILIRAFDAATRLTQHVSLPPIHNQVLLPSSPLTTTPKSQTPVFRRLKTAFQWHRKLSSKDIAFATLIATILIGILGFLFRDNVWHRIFPRRDAIAAISESLIIDDFKTENSYSKYDIPSEYPATPDASFFLSREEWEAVQKSSHPKIGNCVVKSTSKTIPKRDITGPLK